MMGKKNIFVCLLISFLWKYPLVTPTGTKKMKAPLALETSVPAMPIAIPIAACWRAGASFTPSPVIAGTC